MEYVKTTWADKFKSEQREHKASVCYGTTIVECPFCGELGRASSWSLAGTGKRCQTCGAMHSYFGYSFRRKDEKPLTIKPDDVF